MAADRNLPYLPSACHLTILLNQTVSNTINLIVHVYSATNVIWNYGQPVANFVPMSGVCDVQMTVFLRKAFQLNRRIFPDYPKTSSVASKVAVRGESF